MSFSVHRDCRASRLLPFALGVLLSVHVLAESPVNRNAKGLAVHGYDTVAYFTEGRPMKGDARFEHEWNGAVWRFVDRQHLERFADSPERYAPSYGGYCAFAMATGKVVDVDPNAWKIVKGRLFLNYSRRVQRKWRKQQDAYIRAADARWPGVLEDR